MEDLYHAECKEFECNFIPQPCVENAKDSLDAEAPHHYNNFF